MTEIIKDKLYLGNITDANDIYFLNSNRIDTIINVAIDGKISHGIRMNKKVYKYNIFDNENENITKYFQEIFELIDYNDCVLVNCMAGVSRSATIVIAYLMTKQKITLHDAFNFVKSKRPIINPNNGFMKQLVKYENNLFNKNNSIFKKLLSILNI